MLLPPSEWPLKTSAPHILAYMDHQSPPIQMSQKISVVTVPKFTKFVDVVILSLSVNATIHFMICPPVVKWQLKSNIGKTYFTYV